MNQDLAMGEATEKYLGKKENVATVPVFQRSRHLESGRVLGSTHRGLAAATATGDSR